MSLTNSSKLFLLFFLILFALLIYQRVKGQDRDIIEPFSWSKILSQHDIPIYDYKIIQTYTHDPNLFTEGIVLEDNNLYESSGLYRKSTLRRIQFLSGKILSEYKLAPNYFAEGITIFKNHLYQLTYEANIGFIYNKDTLRLEKTFHYPSQGWGLANDGQQLIMSNGSAALLFLDPNSFQIHRYIIVHAQKQPIGFLNALCYANGKIYANIFHANIIAIISPQDGNVEGWIDLRGLNSYSFQSGVLNGIAYDKQDKTLLVTGKKWNLLYKIQLIQRR